MLSVAIWAAVCAQAIGGRLPLANALAIGCSECFELLLPHAQLPDLSAAVRAATLLGEMPRIGLLLKRGSIHLGCGDELGSNGAAASGIERGGTLIGVRFPQLPLGQIRAHRNKFTRTSSGPNERMRACQRKRGPGKVGCSQQNTRLVLSIWRSLVRCINRNAFRRSTPSEAGIPS